MPGIKLTDEDRQRIDLKFICTLCESLLHIPMQTTCGHLMCQSCIESLLESSDPKCPEDGEELSKEKVFSDAFTRCELNAIRLHCPNPGCSWHSTYDQLEGHSQVCEHALIKCTKSQCQMKFQRAHLGEHLKSECKYRNVKCDHCQKDVPFASIKEHVESTCEGAPVTCKYCKENVLRKDVERHERHDCNEVPANCDFQAVGCSHDKWGDDALHVAARAGNVDVVKCLIEHGAQVEWKNEKKSLTEHDERETTDEGYLHFKLEGHNGKTEAEYLAQTLRLDSSLNAGEDVKEALYKHIETTYESFFGRKHDVAAAASDLDEGAETFTSSPKTLDQYDGWRPQNPPTVLGVMYDKNVDNSKEPVLFRKEKGKPPHAERLSTDPINGKENDGGLATWFKNKLKSKITVEMLLLWSPELQVNPVVDSIFRKVRDSFTKLCKQNECRAKMTLLLQLCNAGLCDFQVAPPYSFLIVEVTPGEREHDPGGEGSYRKSTGNQTLSQPKVQHINDLHLEDFYQILTACPLQDVLRSMRVCKTWKTRMSQPYFWLLWERKNSEERNRHFLYNPGKYNGRAYFMTPFPSSWDCRILHSDSLNPFSSGDVDHIQRFCRNLESIRNDSGYDADIEDYDADIEDNDED